MKMTATARALLVSATLLTAAVYLSKVSKAESIPPREPLAGVPMKIDGWSGRRAADLEPEIVKVLGVDDYIMRSYLRADGATAGLYVGYHGSQRQGDTIHSPLNCIPGAGWLPMEQGRITIDVRPGLRAQGTVPIQVNRVVIAKGMDRQLVLYWYQSHRRVVASEYWGKIYTVMDAIRYNRSDAALVRVITPIRENVPVDAADARAVSFVESLFPLLERHLPS